MAQRIGTGGDGLKKQHPWIWKVYLINKNPKRARIPQIGRNKRKRKSAKSKVQKMNCHLHRSIESRLWLDCRAFLYGLLSPPRSHFPLHLSQLFRLLSLSSPIISTLFFLHPSFPNPPHIRSRVLRPVSRFTRKLVVSSACLFAYIRSGVQEIVEILRRDWIPSVPRDISGKSTRQPRKLFFLCSPALSQLRFRFSQPRASIALSP